MFRKVSFPLFVSSFFKIGEALCYLLFFVRIVIIKNYYYAINKTSLEEDGKLFGSIKEQVRERSMDDNRVSYKVYSTKYAENLCYCVAHTNQIQVFPEKEKINLDKP